MGDGRIDGTGEVKEGGNVLWEAFPAVAVMGVGARDESVIWGNELREKGNGADGIVRGRRVPERGVFGELRAEMVNGIEESNLEGGKGVVGVFGYLEFEWRGDDIWLVGEDAVQEGFVG